MHSSVFILLLLVAVASAKAGFQRQNATATKTPPIDQMTAKSARSDHGYGHHGYEHHYPHHGHHFGLGHHHKEFEHYLVPMLLVLGLGLLFMPLLSLLMTTMVGNVPVTTLVSGRRKREVPVKPLPDKTVSDLWQKISRAIDAFSKDYK